MSSVIPEQSKRLVSVPLQPKSFIPLPPPNELYESSYPSCLQATVASSVSHPLIHTLPHSWF